MDALDAITSGANTFSPISQQSQVNAEPLSDAGAAAETEPLHKTEPAMSISAEAGMVRAFIDTLKMTQAVNEEQACVRPEPQNSEPQSLLDALAASSNAGAKIDISDSAAKAIPVAAQTRNRSSMTE
jgi:hypothetical protein